MINEHMKKSSISYAIGEMEIENNHEIPLPTFIMTQIQNTDISAGEDMDEQEFSFIAG